MIKRIRIQNFKSIEDVTVELNDVTVLVGRSGTGKTNFVEALRTLRNMLQKNSLVDVRDVKPKFEQSGDLAYDVTFAVSGLQESFEYSVKIGENWKIPSETLKLGANVLFDRNDADVPGNQFALGQLPHDSDIVIAHTSLTESIGCYHFPSNVLSKPESDDTYNGLADDAGNYLDVLKNITVDLQDLSIRKHILSALQQLNPNVKAVELDSIQRPSRILATHKWAESRLSLNLENESDGFRRYLAHLFALYQRPPKQTLIFEEPENGIFPGALSLLADEFKAAPAAGRGQVILTTHSPQLLDHFDAEEIRVVELDGFKTKIGKLAAEQREALRENLLSAGELLTVDQARIETVEPAAT